MEAAAISPAQGVTGAQLSLPLVRATIPKVVVDPVPDPVTKVLVAAVYSSKRDNAQGPRRRDEVFLAQLKCGESKFLASYREKGLEKGQFPIYSGGKSTQNGLVV